MVHYMSFFTSPDGMLSAALCKLCLRLQVCIGLILWLWLSVEALHRRVKSTISGFLVSLDGNK